MMSLGYIRQMSREAAKEAAEEQKVPYRIWDQRELDEMRGFPFPFLGDYVPPGWTKLDKEYFVDSTGLGAEGEPALTVGQFKEAIREHVAAERAFGVITVGQFQVSVGVYEEVSEEGQ